MSDDGATVAAFACGAMDAPGAARSGVKAGAPAEGQRAGEASPRQTAPARPLVPSVWRLLLGMAIGIGVGVGVILLVNPHIAREVHDAQRASAQPIYLVLALLCTVVVMVTDAWSLLILARVFQPRIHRREVVSTALESHLIGGATSFGGFEIPYQIVMLRRGALSGSQAVSVVIFKGLVHTLILALVALVSLLPWVDSPISPTQRWFLLGASAALLAVWVVAWLWVRRPVGRAFVPERLRGKLDEVIAAARAVGTASRRTVVELVALQLVYWIAMFAILLFVLHALGWRGSVVPIITGQAVMQVLMPLSPLPGGAGIAELTYLALIGPSTPQGVLVSSLVLWRLFTWVIPVAAGAVSLGMRGVRRAT